MIFDINFPTKVCIGEDASAQTGQKLQELGIGRVLCVYDQGVKTAGIVEEITQNIKSAGIEIVEFGKVLPDPSETTVDEVGELGRKEDVDAVLGIGGGSCLDVAKATNVLLANPGSIKNYFGLDIPQKPGKPLILIPTTSGTGSEVSRVAAIEDTASRTKLPVFGPNCTATLAIVDPLLTVSLPPRVTAYTGVDTLAHAIEAYTSQLSTPISDILAVESITLAAKSLVLAVQEGSNVQARFDMCFACTLAGMAFSQAPPHMGHSLGTPLGVRYHLPHGLTVAVGLPGVVEFIADAVPEKIRAIARAMGMNLPAGLSAEEVGLAIGEAIRTLNKTVGIPTMQQLAIPQADFPAIAQEFFNDVCVGFTPKKVSPGDVLKILQKEYAI